MQKKGEKNSQTKNGNESLHKINTDNGIRVVNFATSDISIKSTMFPHRNFHKYTCSSHDGKKHNEIDHVLIDKRQSKSKVNI
jgi:hypothetical protein